MRARQIAMALVIAVAFGTGLSVYIGCEYWPYCWPFAHPIEKPIDGVWR